MSSEKPDEASTPSIASEDTLVYENFEDQSNGVKLVSVKPAGSHEKEQARSDSEGLKVDGDNRTLVSGRQAGKRWETSGIRFAPMNVPLQRRLQTLVVLFHSTCIALSISAFFFLCAIPIFWPLLIIYMIYCMSSHAATSGTLKYRSNLLRSLPVWSLFASYFPARLHRSQELPPTRKYIFGYHPHGIISHGAFAAFATEALGFSQLFPGITNTLLTLDSNFRIPIYRDYVLAMGLASVSRESCENLLSKGGKNNG
jgi:2-acylglycerol O-acyltransferase 2